MGHKKDLERLIDLSTDIFDKTPVISSLSGGGSPRRYYRLQTDSESLIGVVSEDTEENGRYFNVSGFLTTAGINAPQIVAVSPDKNCYLLEDLGDNMLFDVLKREENLKITLSQQSLKELVRIQTLPKVVWAGKVGYKPFSKRLVAWDLNYFKYDFLKPASIEFDEELLEDDFERLSNELMGKEVTIGLMYRDFQSRNIMVKDGNLWFIDFQGAREGPVAYDAVSFIWQAKAPFTFEERERLTKYYAEIFSKAAGVDENRIMDQMEVMEVFRTLQVLGAYGFRGIIQKKPHFLESIPFAISNLKYLKECGRLRNYPEIERIAGLLSEDKYAKEVLREGKLRVNVYSFSYKKGYPEDKTGNGGGFMFDCRAIHNPGRYAEFKNLTGRDHSVITFLEKESEAGDFVKNCFRLVSPSVETYLKRGFTSLQVGFGCTGGQHRSVYCAEMFSKIIKDNFPEVDVILTHREQQISITL